MSDPFTTEDITIYDQDGNPVHVFDDAGIKRIAVDAKISAITLSSLINECNIFRSVIHTIVSKADTVIDTYTVPFGKTFRLVTFQANADHPVAIDVFLKVN